MGEKKGTYESGYTKTTLQQLLMVSMTRVKSRREQKTHSKEPGNAIGPTGLIDKLAKDETNLMLILFDPEGKRAFRHTLPSCSWARHRRER